MAEPHWVRDPPGWYHADDPDPGYDELMRRLPLGPLAILWGDEGDRRLAYVMEDGEVIERNDNS